MRNIVLHFGANYCLPCKSARQYIKSIGKQDNVHFIDVTKDSILANEYNVKNIPTFIKLDVGGKEICRFTGYDEILINAMCQ